MPPSPPNSRCPKFPKAFCANSREEFYHSRDLVALGGVDIYFRSFQLSLFLCKGTMDYERETKRVVDIALLGRTIFVEICH